jgi:hypothetical protein
MHTYILWGVYRFELGDSKQSLAILAVPVQLHRCIKIRTSKTFVSSYYSNTRIYSSVTTGQQFPLQLVHLLMASWAETCSVQIISRD